MEYCKQLPHLNCSGECTCSGHHEYVLFLYCYKMAVTEVKTSSSAETKIRLISNINLIRSTTLKTAMFLNKMVKTKIYGALLGNFGHVLFLCVTVPSAMPLSLAQRFPLVFDNFFMAN